MNKSINEFKTPLVKFKLHCPSDKNYTLTVGQKTFKFNNADRGTFQKFLQEFQFLTDQKPVTKTPNDYLGLVSDIHNGNKPTAYLYKNRADKMYKYLRKKGNPYYKEATISAPIMPNIKITTEPKKKKKTVLFGGMYKINEKLFDCESVEDVKRLFIKESTSNLELNALRNINHWAKMLTHENSTMWERKEEIKEILFEGVSEYENIPLIDIYYRDPNSGAIKFEDDYDSRNDDLYYSEAEIGSIERDIELSDDQDEIDELNVRLEEERENLEFEEDYTSSITASYEEFVEIKQRLHTEMKTTHIVIEGNNKKKENIYDLKTRYLLKNFSEFNFMGTHTVGNIDGYLLEKDGYSFHIPTYQVHRKYLKNITDIKALGSIKQIGDRKVNVQQAKKSLKIIQKSVGSFKP